MQNAVRGSEVTRCSEDAVENAVKTDGTAGTGGRMAMKGTVSSSRMAMKGTVSSHVAGASGVREQLKSPGCRLKTPAIR